MKNTSIHLQDAMEITWLGTTPAHWKLCPIGSCFRERREKVNDRDYPPLSVTKDGVVPQLETAAKTDDNDNRKCVMEGDFVINSRSDRKGSSGIAKQSGSVSLINTVLCPSEFIVGDFAHHLFRSVNFQEEYYRFGKGIVADLWSTNYSAMKRITIPVPPVDEQRSIAAFLDAETSKIDALVAEQRRLIELLKEKRQAVISHAVTKGLNPHVKMKPSGIDWLGEVPEHWETSKLKYVLRSVEQGWSPQCENDPVESYEQWGVLKVGCVNNGKFNPDENKALPQNLTPILELAIKRNDLLISRANTVELVGSAAIVEQDYPKLLLCDKLYRLRLNDAILLPEFACFFLNSEIARTQIEQRATGASPSMKNIGQSVILDMTIAIPDLEEQHDICKRTRQRCFGIDRLMQQSEHVITILQERRTALISAAVTGKIDVRGFVKKGEENAALCP